MDSGPLRVPPSSDRRVVNRSEPAAQRQAVEEPQQKVESRAPSRAPSHYVEKEKKSSKRFLWPIIIALLVIALAAAAWFVLGSKKVDTGIDNTKYQAVFLSNGQIYFGKLYTHSDETMRLTDGYFPQAQADASADDEEATDTSGGIQLIRLGDEVYGPENEIFISKDQILHYENLRTDSKVARLIQQNEQSR